MFGEDLHTVNHFDEYFFGYGTHFVQLGMYIHPPRAGHGKFYAVASEH